MSTKKTTKTTSNQTQTNAPPAWTLPGLQAAGGRVSDALAGPAPAAYTGDFVAVPNQDRVNQNIALTDQLGTRAAGFGDQVAGAMNQLGQVNTPDAWVAGDGTAELNAAVKAGIDPVFKQLMEQTLPGITNSALSSGAYGNSRALGVVPGQAINAANESAQRIGAQLAFENFQRSQDRSLSAWGTKEGLDSTAFDQQTQRLGMLPGMANDAMALYASQADLFGAGTQMDAAQRQAIINNNLARHDYNVRQPYEGLDIASSLLAQLSGNYGTQTGNANSTTVEKTGGLGPILQGAIGIGSMAASMGAFGPLGGAAGAAGGAAGAGASGAAAGAGMGGLSSLFRR